MAAAKKSKKNRKQHLARARKRKQIATQRRRQAQDRSRGWKSGLLPRGQIKMSEVLENSIDPSPVRNPCYLQRDRPC